jgi:hypothetical protein
MPVEHSRTPITWPLLYWPIAHYTLKWILVIIAIIFNEFRTQTDHFFFGRGHKFKSRKALYCDVVAVINFSNIHWKLKSNAENCEFWGFRHYSDNCDQTKKSLFFSSSEALVATFFICANFRAQRYLRFSNNSKNSLTIFFFITCPGTSYTYTTKRYCLWLNHGKNYDCEIATSDHRSRNKFYFVVYFAVLIFNCIRWWSSWSSFRGRFDYRCLEQLYSHS